MGTTENTKINTSIANTLGNQSTVMLEVYHEINEDGMKQVASELILHGVQRIITTTDDRQIVTNIARHADRSRRALSKDEGTVPPAPLELQRFCLPKDKSWSPHMANTVRRAAVKHLRQSSQNPTAWVVRQDSVVDIVAGRTDTRHRPTWLEQNLCSVLENLGVQTKPVNTVRYSDHRQLAGACEHDSWGWKCNRPTANEGTLCLDHQRELEDRPGLFEAARRSAQLRDTAISMVAATVLAQASGTPAQPAGPVITTTEVDAQGRTRTRQI